MTATYLLHGLAALIAPIHGLTGSMRGRPIVLSTSAADASPPPPPAEVPGHVSKTFIVSFEPPAAAVNAPKTHAMTVGRRPARRCLLSQAT